MRLTPVGFVAGIGAAIYSLGLKVDFSAAPWLTFTPKWGVVSVASDLIQAYAILAGLIVQVITLVALAFSPGQLAPARVKKVTVELDTMQRQLLALFAVYVSILFLAVCSKLSIDTSPGATPPHDLQGVWVAALAFLVVFSLGRTADMGRSILSVHRVRSEMLNEQAKVDAAEGELPVEPDPSPESYGDKVTSINRR